MRSGEGETSDVSGPSRESFAPGPEAAVLVGAVEALIDGDSDRGRAALHRAVAVSSWDAVEHRLEVLGRALVADADLEPQRGPHPDAVHVEGVPRSTEERWAAAWTALQAIAHLVERAGYPPEVLA